MGYFSEEGSSTNLTPAATNADSWTFLLIVC